jgi:hypothetical protein
MKTMFGVLSSSLVCLACLGGPAQAQTIPISQNLFGVNYWYYDYASKTDSFNAKKELVRAAGISFVRLGGNTPNKKLALTDMVHFDLAIDRVLSIGATPLMQLPMNLPAADIGAWVTHFKDNGIKYWSLGNEPDPSSNFIEWYKGIPVGTGTTPKLENGNTYKMFRDKLVALARALKSLDPDAIVIGPDFRLWWGSESDKNSPMGSYYPDFIADVGALTENGHPLLDIFAFHFYGYHDETENRRRIELVQKFLDTANLTRSSPLRMAVGEINATTSATAPARPWSFEAGQFLVTTLKNVVANGGEFVAPWSVSEGNGAFGDTDFSTFNNNGSMRSTMTHIAALAKQRRAFYMAGAIEGTAYNNLLTQFGMSDGGGSTVMLMNTSANNVSYSARLDGQYSNLDGAARFKFDSKNRNASEWRGTLPGKTSLMFSFDANGRRLQKWEYNKTTANSSNADPTALPLVTDLGVAGAVLGTRDDITLSAVLPAGAARSEARFYVDGALQGSATAAPFAITIDSSRLANGPHSLVVKALDLDGNLDSSEALEFSTLNAINVSALVRTLSSGLVLNRTTQTFNGTITVTNTGSTSIEGPIQVELAGLSPGVTLVNANGTHKGAPYVSAAGVSRLDPGASTTVKLSFANPDKAAVSYSALTFSGSF